MVRESVATKGERYLLSGRLTVVAVSPDSFRALVKGDSGHQYQVIHDAGYWHCSCPARGRCAHLMALARVWVAPDSKGLP